MASIRRKGEEISNQVLGRTLQNAENYVKEHGFVSRIEKREGKESSTKRDQYKPNRVNLVVRSGKVVASFIG